MVGLTRFELVTPRLSSVCSNQLSYRPLSLGTPLRRCQALLLHSIKEPVYSERLTAFPSVFGPILSKLDRRACQ